MSNIVSLYFRVVLFRERYYRGKTVRECLIESPSATCFLHLLPVCGKPARRPQEAGDEAAQHHGLHHGMSQESEQAIGNFILG